MLERANRNKEKTCAGNVSFIESAITDVALPDGIADCIISNCVVNLVPEGQKQLAFNEMFRLLKPSGRVAISDILIKRELPDELKKSMALYVGCISGASLVRDYERYLRQAGFGGNDWFPVISIIHLENLMLTYRDGADILITNSKQDLNVYSDTNEDGTRNGCCGSGTDKSCCDKSASCCNAEEHPEGNDLNGFTSEFKDLDLNEWAGICGLGVLYSKSY
jgi:arsenite methyltransferase